MCRRQMMSCLLISALLGLPLLANPGLITGEAWAGCYEEPYTTACLLEWSTCTRGDGCTNGKDQNVDDGAFGCRSSAFPVECLDGKANNMAFCYRECDCIEEDGACNKGTSCQNHNHVLKVSDWCAYY